MCAGRVVLLLLDDTDGGRSFGDIGTGVGDTVLRGEILPVYLC